MANSQSFDSWIEHKLSTLETQRTNTQEYGLSTPIISLEIAALQLVASASKALKTVIN